MTVAVELPITLTQHAQCSDEVLLQEVGGESVLLDLASEQYFGLDPVGTRIWALIGEGADLEAVNNTLCTEYDAEPATITHDLIALVTTLANAGLVKVS